VRDHLANHSTNAGIALCMKQNRSIYRKANNVANTNLSIGKSQDSLGKEMQFQRVIIDHFVFLNNSSVPPHLEALFFPIY
jgi:hypothetical protein